LVVFAFNAPYYLDATDISKLTAYFALYSKVPKSFDVAARILFHEIRAQGALPVSVSGVGYDLNTATFPDPAQTIPLKLDMPEAGTAVPSGTPQITSTPQFKIGDTIPVVTGIILDHNGHVVPDKTIVSFVVTKADNTTFQPIVAETSAGIAKASIHIEGAGLYSIRVESDPAKQSAILKFNVPPEGGTVVVPTATLPPTITPTPKPSATPIPPTQEIKATPPPAPTKTNINDWLLSIIVSLAISIGVYLASSSFGQVRWGIRAAMLAMIGGLLAYTYLAVGMPGSVTLVRDAGTTGVILVTALGSGIGGSATWGWRFLQTSRKS